MLKQCPPPHNPLPTFQTISRLMSEQLAGSTRSVWFCSSLFNHSLSLATLPHHSPLLSLSFPPFLILLLSHPSHPRAPHLWPCVFTGGAVFCFLAQLGADLWCHCMLCLETIECQNARKWWMLGKHTRAGFWGIQCVQSSAKFLLKT